jgi:hypothetical protein
MMHNKIKEYAAWWLERSQRIGVTGIANNASIAYEEAEVILVIQEKMGS